MPKSLARSRTRRFPCRVSQPARRPTTGLRLELLEDRTLLNAGLHDPTFVQGGPAIQGVGQGLALQADGKIVVGAQTLTPGTAITEIEIARYNADGSLDKTFGNNGAAVVPVATTPSAFEVRIAVQPDGKILAVGAMAVVRFTSSGALDSTFGVNGLVSLTSTGNDVALQSDGKILVADANLERLNADGTPDTIFGSGGRVVLSSPPSEVVVQQDGRIIVAGSFLGRFNPDGTSDSTFGAGGQVALNFTAADVALQANGRIVAAGSVPDPNTAGATDFAVGRFDVNGSADATFGGAGFVRTRVLDTSRATAVLIQRDAKIVAVGSARSNTASGNNIALVRYNPNGMADSTFGNISGGQTVDFIGDSIGADDAVLQADGRVLVVGTFVLPRVPGTLMLSGYTPDPPISDPDQRFLNQVYLDLLQRPVDPSGLVGWSGAMIAGMTRTQVIAAIEGSQEYHTLQVQYFYGLLLNRPADAGGLGVWLNFLGQGHTAEQMEAMILGSDEYFARHGSTNAGYLQALYADTLQRPIDSVGAMVWGQALANGTSRALVAASVLGSMESDMDEVQALYHQLLRRAADPGGLATFTTALQQSVSNEAVLALIAGSDEYVARLFMTP